MSVFSGEMQVVYWVTAGHPKNIVFGPTFDRKAAWEFADGQPGVPAEVRYSYLESKRDVHWTGDTV